MVNVLTSQPPRESEQTLNHQTGEATCSTVLKTQDGRTVWPTSLHILTLRGNQTCINSFLIEWFQEHGSEFTGSKLRHICNWLVQVEFVAEDEIVEIVPNIRMEALNMICVRHLFLHWHLFSIFFHTFLFLITLPIHSYYLTLFGVAVLSL